jgi:hypothetical protein
MSEFRDFTRDKSQAVNISWFAPACRPLGVAGSAKSWFQAPDFGLFLIDNVLDLK